MRILLILLLVLLFTKLSAQYYEDVDTTNSQTLKSTLHNIIDSHTMFPYTSQDTDTWDVLYLADQDPFNPDNIWTIYKNASYEWLGGGIQVYQNNRNPFIDHPEWVLCVFANDCFLANDVIFKK